MALKPDDRASGGFARARRRFPPRTASDALRQIFNLMTERGISLRALAEAMDTHPNRLSDYRRGKSEAGILTVEEMAQHLGYRLQLVPIPPKSED